RYRPVAVETMRWKRDFHRWFATDTALEVPIVAANTIPEGDRARFPLTSRSPTDLPHEPLGANCIIDEHLDDLVIDFTTTCPGMPHEIAVSYYPNWQVEGADRVYLTSPACMLVFPDRTHVQLGWKAFEKQDYPTAIDYFERTITLGGDTTTAGDGTFFRAASLLRSGKPAEALEGYHAVIEGFPAAIWVAESYYHVGLCLRQLRRLREAKA